MPDPTMIVTHTVEGKTYRFYWGNKALRLFQNESGYSTERLEAMADPNAPKPTMQEAGLMIWASLQQYHRDVDMDVVDDLIDADSDGVYEAFSKAAAAGTARRTQAPEGKLTEAPADETKNGAGTTTKGRHTPQVSAPVSSGS